MIKFWFYTCFTFATYTATQGLYCSIQESLPFNNLLFCVSLAFYWEMPFQQFAVAVYFILFLWLKFTLLYLMCCCLDFSSSQNKIFSLWWLSISFIDLTGKHCTSIDINIPGHPEISGHFLAEGMFSGRYQYSILHLMFHFVFCWYSMQYLSISSKFIKWIA